MLAYIASVTHSPVRVLEGAVCIITLFFFHVYGFVRVLTLPDMYYT
jgi:hypothetical protein